MIHVVVIEGARGTGKSTVARLLRDRLPTSTLINPTGFKQDGDEGLNLITAYYEGLSEMLQKWSELPEKITIVFDRLFFSELVYSRLYKSYSFEDEFQFNLTGLAAISDQFDLFLLRATEDTFKTRLIREKSLLFEGLEESIEASLQQQEVYNQMLKEIMPTSRMIIPKFNSYIINTDDFTADGVAKLMLKVL